MATLESLRLTIKEIEARELPPRTLGECAKAARDPERLLAMMFREALNEDEDASPRDRISALTVLIKAAGLLKERLEHEVKITTEEWDARVARANEMLMVPVASSAVLTMPEAPHVYVSQASQSKAI